MRKQLADTLILAYATEAEDPDKIKSAEPFTHGNREMIINLDYFKPLFVVNCYHEAIKNKCKMIFVVQYAGNFVDVHELLRSL